MYIGTPTLHRIAADASAEWTDEEAAAHGINFQQVVRLARSRDEWFFPFIAQYHNDTPSMEDASWYPHIKQMVADGRLYMALFRIKSWAFADVDFDRNMENARSSGLDIGEAVGTSDATFSSNGKKVSMGRVYMTDEQTPTEVPQIPLELSGCVEIGTQSIAKTAMSLLSGIPLMRIPYDPQISWLPPTCCIFHNTEPHAL